MEEKILLCILVTKNVLAIFTRFFHSIILVMDLLKKKMAKFMNSVSKKGNSLVESKIIACDASNLIGFAFFSIFTSKRKICANLLKKLIFWVDHRRLREGIWKYSSDNCSMELAWCRLNEKNFNHSKSFLTSNPHPYAYIKTSGRMLKALE